MKRRLARSSETPRSRIYFFSFSMAAIRREMAKRPTAPGRFILQIKFVRHMSTITNVSRISFFARARLETSGNR